MKTKVIIENGESKIVLTPENDFEKDILEKLYDDKYETSTVLESDYCFGSLTGRENYRLNVHLKETK